MIVKVDDLFLTYFSAQLDHSERANFVLYILKVDLLLLGSTLHLVLESLALFHQSSLKKQKVVEGYGLEKCWLFVFSIIP
jgi:hypothetical protein